MSHSYGQAEYNDQRLYSQRTGTNSQLFVNQRSHILMMIISEKMMCHTHVITENLILCSLYYVIGSGGQSCSYTLQPFSDITNVLQ
jgi:hypothetical protein